MAQRRTDLAARAIAPRRKLSAYACTEGVCASSLALPLGDHADTVIVWAVLLTFGAVVYLIFRLGETLFSRWVGIVAALVVLTRPALQRE